VYHGAHGLEDVKLEDQNLKDLIHTLEPLRIQGYVAAVDTLEPLRIQRRRRLWHHSLPVCRLGFGVWELRVWDLGSSWEFGVELGVWEFGGWGLGVGVDMQPRDYYLLAANPLRIESSSCRICLNQSSYA
jgi:hypothetical protein